MEALEIASSYKPSPEIQIQRKKSEKSKNWLVETRMKQRCNRRAEVKIIKGRIVVRLTSLSYTRSIKLK